MSFNFRVLCAGLMGTSKLLLLFFELAGSFPQFWQFDNKLHFSGWQKSFFFYRVQVIFLNLKAKMAINPQPYPATQEKAKLYLREVL